MGERLINHIDEMFESIVGKALRSESQYLKSKTEVASTEEPKPQASSGGKNGSQNKRKQNQTKDGQKKKNENFITGLDQYLGERLIYYIDETFESIMGKALRSKSL